MTYAIFDDEQRNQECWRKLSQGLSAISQSSKTLTAAVEGNIRTGKATCRGHVLSEMSEKLELLDPDSVLRKI